MKATGERTPNAPTAEDLFTLFPYFDSKEALMKPRRIANWVASMVIAAGLLVVLWITIPAPACADPAPPATPSRADADRWVVIAWNDLGMHCYNRDFQDLAVLPPYNNLWSQVIKVGDPPQIVTTGVTLTYAFADNTYSVGKSNFWTYEEALFKVKLPPDIGLTGKGLAGTLDPSGNHFTAEGIPLTEFRDSALAVPYPYQLATIVAKDVATGQELARVTTVAPVSTEMHCDKCHHDGGVEGIHTGRLETNILTLHDEENSEDYPKGHTGRLMDRRPVLCAECHASNALGKPGVLGVPSLSHAIHDQHAEEVPSTLEGCYNCHPGPTTKCLRDIMSQKGMTCIECHGTMRQVANNPNPWLNEPRCDTCHTGGAYDQNQALYRRSTGHGGIACAGCHDSPHAIAPSTQPNDAIKFLAWQGHTGSLDTCTVCHATPPKQPGPHGLVDAASLTNKVYLPVIMSPR